MYNEYAGTEVFDIDQKTIFEVMRKRFSEVALAFPRGCRVLDVGCGSGLLLDAICQHFDCEGKGIDVDRRGIAAGKAHAKRATFECGLFDPARLETTYDVILSTAVVEHVLDPVGFLKQLTHGLSKGGSIFLSTPNASSLNYWLLRSWWRELLSIGEHIYLFTPESLNACAQKAGLQLVSASSGFDYGPFRFQLDSARNAVITIWALYRLLVKHLSICFASRLTGDILFAHYKMAKI